MEPNSSGFQKSIAILKLYTIRQQLDS
uniref:Uncharacterized protein n=1 Tax=Rhizophora mucronata TaxID=61149 RepID=A0A2P2PZF9_RHIMU